MLPIQTLHAVDTEYSADSVEWCPHPEFNNYFVCGTYQLQEGNSEKFCSRKGRIYLYKFDFDARTLNEIYRLETTAILDMRWVRVPASEQPLLATATAAGEITIYAFEHMKLNTLQVISLGSEHENRLALSLDWNQKSNQTDILASDSKGAISLLCLSNERELKKMRTWTAHNFEAWICAFDKWDTNRVFTGGDDTFLHAYDLRMEGLAFLNRTHTAGVTCLLSHPVRENILLTGSYDEHLRIFDTRSMKQPMSDINLSGGIWRLKSHPLHNDMILTACMYHNFNVVDIQELTSPQLISEYFEHKSICYGADWCCTTDGQDLLMATCSFYDHKLCVSSLCMSKTAELEK